MPELMPSPQIQEQMHPRRNHREKMTATLLQPMGRSRTTTPDMEHTDGLFLFQMKLVPSRTMVLCPGSLDELEKWWRSRQSYIR